MKWVVFFSDGSFVTSEDAAPFSIDPRVGIQVIVQPNNEHVWVTLSGTDYYYWDDKGKGAKWWCCNDRSGLDYYLRQPGEKAVLFGTWIEKEDFGKIFHQALDMMGEKAGYDSEERKP